MWLFWENIKTTWGEFKAELVTITLKPKEAKNMTIIKRNSVFHGSVVKSIS